MGQYFTAVNLDKEEYVDGHDIDNGAKLLEQVGWMGSTSTALWLLLADNSDARLEHAYVSRWAGDRIIVLGDYGNMDLCETVDEEYTNISAGVKEMLEELL